MADVVSEKWISDDGDVNKYPQLCEALGLSNEFATAYAAWRRGRIEELTKDLDLNEIALGGEEALLLRHGFSIGGTTASAIIGYNPYATAEDAYKTLTGPLQGHSGNYLTMRGLALETAIARRAAALLNRTLYTPSYSTTVGYWQNRAHWYEDNASGTGTRQVFFDDLDFFHMSCQIDALLSSSNGFTICECKTANHNPKRKDNSGLNLWGKGLGLNDYGDVIEDQEVTEKGRPVIPDHYYFQVQWQLLMLRILNALAQVPGYNADHAFLAADIAGNTDVRLYKIEADLDVQTWMFSTSLYFMANNVMAGSPPVKAVNIVPELEVSDAERGVVIADATFLADLEHYYQLVAQGKEFTEQADALKEQLIARLGEKGTEVKDPNTEKVLLRRSTYSRSSFDTKALANDHPDLYRKYMTKKQTTRISFVQDKD